MVNEELTTNDPAMHYPVGHLPTIFTLEIADTAKPFDVRILCAKMLRYRPFKGEMYWGNLPSEKPSQIVMCSYERTLDNGRAGVLRIR